MTLFFTLRLAPAARDDCFKLIGVLLQRLGPSWLFPDAPSKKTAPKKPSPASLVDSLESLSLSDGEIDKKFAALVVHLTCVEVRVLMDELAEDLPTGTSSATQSADKATSTTKVRREQVLPFAYEILEVSIGYLVQISESDGPEYGVFDATGLLKIQESLQSTFAAILDYLRDLQVWLSSCSIVSMLCPISRAYHAHLFPSLFSFYFIFSLFRPEQNPKRWHPT